MVCISLRRQYHGKHTTIVPPAILATVFPKQSLLQKAVNPFISARRLHSAGLDKEAGNVGSPAGDNRGIRLPLSVRGEGSIKTAAGTRRRNASVLLAGESHLKAAVDPGQNTADFGVNSRLVNPTAALAPAGDPHQVPQVAALTHQRSAAVPL